MNSISSISKHSSQMAMVCLQSFLTSRPDLPVRWGVQIISVDANHANVLQGAAFENTIQHDPLVYLQNTFSTACKAYDHHFTILCPMPLHKALEMKSLARIANIRLLKM